MGSQVKNEDGSSTDWRTGIGVAKSVQHLYNEKLMTDIIFTFPDQEAIQAHKLILGMRSAVFEAMFYGSLSEQRSEVLITDIERDIFDTMLQFIYTNEVKVTGDSVIKCLNAGKKYCIEDLINICEKFLEESISCDNVCTIFEQARFFQLKYLIQKCENFMQNNAITVAQNDDFKNLQLDSLREFLANPKIRNDEMKYFMAVNSWAEVKCKQKHLEVTPTNIRVELGEALNEIKFGLFSPEQFAQVVTTTNLLTADEQAKIYPWLILKTLPPEDLLKTFPSVPRESVDISVNVRVNKENEEMNLNNKIVVKILPSHSIQLKVINVNLPSALVNVKLIESEGVDDNYDDTNGGKDITSQIGKSGPLMKIRNQNFLMPGKTYTFVFNLKRRDRTYYSSEDVTCTHYKREDLPYVHGGVYIKMPGFVSCHLSSITYAVKNQTP